LSGGCPRVCDNCGEEYLDETTTAELLNTADAAAQARTGVQQARDEGRRHAGAYNILWHSLPICGRLSPCVLP
jgi:hypothetical protein